MRDEGRLKPGDVCQEKSYKKSTPVDFLVRETLFRRGLLLIDSGSDTAVE